MNKIVTILLILIYSTCYSQNLEDAYNNHSTPTPSHWSNDELFNFNGEYQIFTDKFFWNADFWGGGNPLKDADVSFSIEVVSFPFIPEDLDPYDNNNLMASEERVLTTDFVEYGYVYGNLLSNNLPYEVNYDGYGWQFGNYRIFQKIRNINTCDNTAGNSECEGDYGLISQVYSGGISQNYYYQCHLPHTVLKHTLYFHCPDSSNNYIIDSISWIYDNTRGAMKNYPFCAPTTDHLIFEPIVYDVCFRPTLPDLGQYFYGPDTSNASWYNSGLANRSGSVDYFPPSEVFPNYNMCSTFPLYYSPYTATYPYMLINYSSNIFYSPLVHPPSYILLDAPLLNAQGGEYAGYDVSGNSMEGVEHKYEINTPFDLRIINPSEKIIYNPSEVTINTDLIFPCHYKFLTIHGKYPDKNYEVHHGGDFSSQYWDMNPFFDFEYDRDYPVPVNDTTNSENLSIYTIHACTLTIEPYVIIMDAYFEGSDAGSGRGYIKGNLNHIFGNWDYDDATITIIPDYTTPEHCISHNIDNGGKTLPLTETIVNETEKLKILNGGSHNTQIKINTEPSPNTYIKVYNSFGGLILTEEIIHDGQIIDCSDFKRGVYHVALILNGEIVQKQSFSKM